MIICKRSRDSPFSTWNCRRWNVMRIWQLLSHPLKVNSWSAHTLVTPCLPLFQPGFSSPWCFGGKFPSHFQLFVILICSSKIRPLHSKVSDTVAALRRLVEKKQASHPPKSKADFFQYIRTSFMQTSSEAKSPRLPSAFFFSYDLKMVCNLNRAFQALSFVSLPALWNK